MRLSRYRRAAQLLDIREEADLDEREAALTVIRIAQLERRFIPGDFDIVEVQLDTVADVADALDVYTPEWGGCIEIRR